MIVVDRAEDLDFARFVRSGDTVVCGQGIAEPVTLTSALVAQRASIGRFSMFLGPTFSTTFNVEQADTIALISWCGTGSNAKLHAANALDIVPAHYSDLPLLFAQTVLRSDVVLLNLAEADGKFNLALSNDYVVDAARRARFVIAEVPAGLPWTVGGELPADIHPHVVVRTTRAPLTLADPDATRASEEERAIAALVVSLIPNGATLAVGVGVLPSLVFQ